MTLDGSAPAAALDDLIGTPPSIILRSGNLADAAAPVVAVALATGDDGPVFEGAARQVAADLDVRLDRLIESESLRGDAGSVLAVPLAGEEDSVRRLLVVGVGAGRPADWRAAGAALARRGGSVPRLALVASPPLDGLRAFAEGVILGSYRVSGLLDRAGRLGRPPGDAGVSDAGVLETGGPGTPARAAVPNGAVGALGRDDLNVNEVAVDEAGLDVDTVDGTGASAGGPAADTAGVPREVVVVTDLAAEAAARAAVRAARAVGIAVYIARDLVNTPSLVKSPEWLADRAVRIATAAGLTASVLGPRELAEQGFGGLRAVGQGSPRPPRLVRIEYDGQAATPAGAAGSGVSGSGGVSGSAEPGAAEPGSAAPGSAAPEYAAPEYAASGSGMPEPGPAASGTTADGRFAGGHRVLVGKGITFDSGGLSLKPAVSMIGMKTDMAGAAAVLGTMTALSALGVPGRVTGLLCLAENMIGGAAMRPGDVITCWGGTTVEVLNTDAEGRLVLADGLAYAAGELGADVIVDLATLTGAIAVALGRRTAGLFSSDDDLAGALSAAAGAAGEQVWRLPLTEEYRPALDSPVADLANIGRALDVGGGSITAALFLREFVGGLPWAHLDIAGTARADSDDGEISRGGTGWGVRTLLSWLSSDVAAAAASSTPAR
jgi:leucyl aminopeptidase